MVLVGLLTFAACWCLGGPGMSRPLRARPDALTTSAVAERRPALVEDPIRRTLVCVAAAMVATALWSGWTLSTVGVPVGLLLSVWIGRMESPREARRREAIGRDLPLAADLLAACAAAGRPTDESLVVVSRAIGGPLGELLDHIVARLALGADPVAEWRALSSHPQLSALGRTLRRSLESGAPLAQGLTRLADDSRRERRTATQAKARKVGVRAAAPLAACFLPAFMLIGIVPTIAGAFTHLVLR